VDERASAWLRVMCQLVDLDDLVDAGSGQRVNAFCR